MGLSTLKWNIEYMSTIKEHKNGDLSGLSPENMTVDQVFDKIREIDPVDSKGDAAIARKLGLSKSAPGQSRVNKTLPYAPLVEYSLKNGVDLNWLFNNKPTKPQIHDATTPYGVSQSNKPVITEKVMKNAMMVINEEIARAQIPFSEEVLEMLIKTYISFKDKPGVNIKTVVRAVAESQIK